MRKSFVSVLLALVFTGLLLAQSPVDYKWKSFSCDSGNFSITLPEQPEPFLNRVESEYGPLDINLFLCDLSTIAEKGILLYGIMYVKYPVSVTNSFTDTLKMKNFFDQVIQGSANAVNGKVSSQQNAQFNGFPGRTAIVESSEGLSVDVRYFLSGTVLYCLQTICMKGISDEWNKDKFISSFKLLKK